MTAENRPSFKTQVIETIKDIGLLLRFGFDPTQDPIYVEYKRMKEAEKAGLMEPQTFVGRLRNAVRKGGI